MGSEETRRDPRLTAALRRIAPGTGLREGLNDIIRGHLGALIVIGEPAELHFLFSGGLQLDQPFTPQYLYELAKMDGAIVLNANTTRIVCANVQLMPDPTIPSAETGTRHRTAERTARQNGALVISISQSRDTLSIYVGDVRYQLEAIADVLAKTNQALDTLETYRARLDQVASRLTALEFQHAVTLDDVLVVLQRAEMAARMAEEIEGSVIELGREGRLIDMRLSELAEDVPRERINVVRDYENSAKSGGAHRVLKRLAELPYKRLLDFDEVSAVLGYPDANPLEVQLRPRGYRALAQIPRVSDRVARSLVEAFGGLDAILRASLREIENTDGLDEQQAREVREGLRRLQEHNLMDRYLSL